MHLQKGFVRPPHLFGILFCAIAQAASPTTTALQTSSAPLTNGQTVYTLTATVKSGGTAITPGLVNFNDGSRLLGSAQLTSSGVATFRTRLPLGTQSVTASFVGTKAWAASSSSAASLSVTGPTPTSTTTFGATASAPAGHYNVTASVSSAGLQPPSGKVNFVDQSNANLVLGSATLGSPSAPFAFAPSAVYPLGNSPLAIAAGDFNNDGIVDLVVSDGSGLDVRLGNPDGTFQARISMPAPSVRTLVVADFNGDGFLDVAIAGGGVSIYLGHGDGTFAPPQSLALPGNAFSMAVGDFNGDGIPDLAIAEGTIGIAMGKGDGSFQPVFQLPDPSGAGAIATADVNGDGVADIVVANSSLITMSVLLGNGDGTFQPQVEYSAGPAGYYPDAVVLGDFNHDGFPDVAIGQIASGLTVLINNGNGTFGSPTIYGVARRGNQIALADINADGNPDIILAPQGGDPFVYVVPGNGAGTFGQPFFLAPAMFTDTFAGVAVADFNGDGLPDIATTSDKTVDALVFLNTLVQTSTTSGAISVPGGGMHNVAASWPGDGAHQGSVSTAQALQGAQIADTLTLTGSISPVQFGVTETLTATLQPSSADNYFATGTVTFSDNGNQIGTQLVSSGMATLQTNSLPLGGNNITATYSGDSNFTGATSNSVAITVVPAGRPTTTSVTSNPTPSALTNQNVTFTATITSNGSAVTVGTVTFSEGGNVISGPTAVNGSGTAPFSTSTLAEGIHTIAASYSDSSNTHFPSSGTLSIEIDTPTTIPSAGEYCNAGTLSIIAPNGNNNTQATPYPSRINVTGMAGTVKTLVVLLPAILLSNPAASAMALTGPNNSNIVFWNDAGGAIQNPYSPEPVLLQDGGPLIPTDQTVPGVFAPTSYMGNIVFPAPGPASLSFAQPQGSQTFTSAFQNINANGYWDLFWINRPGNYPASLNGGWCVGITNNPPVLAVSKSHTGAFSQGDTADTYTITVTNNGPGSTAGTITLADTLPTGFTATAISQTNHSGGGTGTDWSCVVASANCTRTTVMPQGEIDTITLTVRVASNAPTGSNAVTNRVSVSGGGANGVSANDPTTINPAMILVRFATNPAGLSYTVDNTSYTATQTLSLAAGSQHTISVTSPQTSAGVQNSFTGWSDGGAQSHTIAILSTVTTYTASFSTSYLLTTSASPAGGGSVTPAPGTFYPAGSIVNLIATPNGGYRFTTWTGSVASTNSAATTIAMNAPQSVTANFALAYTNVTSSVQVSSTPFIYSRATRTFNSTYTITNISGQPIAGPLQLVMSGLSSPVTVANATATFQGSPYVTIPGSTPLGSGASASVTVQFSDPTNVTIEPTISVYSGAF